MLCLPAAPHLYISSDKIRAFTEASNCNTVLLLGGKGKHHICIARFLKQLERAETRGVKKILHSLGTQPLPSTVI